MSPETVGELAKKLGPAFDVIWNAAVRQVWVNVFIAWLICFPGLIVGLCTINKFIKPEYREDKYLPILIIACLVTLFGLFGWILYGFRFVNVDYYALCAIKDALK